MSRIILGIKVDSRRDDATSVQALLTEYGCFIKTRLGLHNASDERTMCSEDGLILLEFILNADQEALELEQKLEALGSVHVRKMVF
ncbi:hypothetical protein KHM83_13440 [Fusibacter paucivorans]|uniref:Iron-only hydrogenase system regulator n=1 Tax=Fusibacter paucivorans TaxID=76009 RepID=A0ABS5PRA1_9FIRM|nr:hypothetical protein [Fusibacter paucivorans]MBS7527684.1 hypothetical protein [Fusibacter paucivorans]